MRIRGSILAATLLAILASCASQMSSLPGKPPAAPAEPTEVRPGFVWIEGHWSWRDRWLWDAGSWAPERPGYAWSPGMWIIDRDRYQWSPGRWTKLEHDPCDEW